MQPRIGREGLHSVPLRVLAEDGDRSCLTHSGSGGFFVDFSVGSAPTAIHVCPLRGRGGGRGVLCKNLWAGVCLAEGGHSCAPQLPDASARRFLAWSCEVRCCGQECPRSVLNVSSVFGFAGWI